MADLSWFLLLNKYFWTSLTLSMINPMANKMTPAMSLPVPNAGWGYCVMLGEFSTVTGSETVQTQSIWKTQKPKKGKNLSLLSSKRSSLPVLRIRKRRNAESRAPQSMMKMDTTICRAWWVSLNARVMIARTTKFVPPAKSADSISCVLKLRMLGDCMYLSICRISERKRWQRRRVGTQLLLGEWWPSSSCLTHGLPCLRFGCGLEGQRERINRGNRPVDISSKTRRSSHAHL